MNKEKTLDEKIIKKLRIHDFHDTLIVSDVREAVLELKGKIEENKVGVNMKCNNCGNITEMSICPECAFYDLSDNFMIRVDELYEDINKIFGKLAEEDLK